MSDSTIDDALRLLEIGKGNPDRLKQIIESFQKRSMISMQDRKYVDALVEQYLTPRHRQMTSKMKPSERQKTNFPRIRKTTESSFKITEVKATSEKTKSEERTTENPYIKSTEEIKKSEPQKEELASKEPTIEEKFIEHVEKDRSTIKKSNKGKVVGIIIGIIAVIELAEVRHTWEVVQIYFLQNQKLKKELRVKIIYYLYHLQRFLISHHQEKI